MEDEKEQINHMEKLPIKRETSDTELNTSGYASDTSERDYDFGTESREPARSNLVDKVSDRFSRLTAGGSPGNDANVSTLSDSARQEASSVAEKPLVHEASEVTSDSTGSLLDLKFPSPPKDSPNNDSDNDPASAAVTDAIDSKSSQTSRDSYKWSLASSDLPSWNLNDDEEQIISPLQKEFSITDKFEENSHYTLSVELGVGAFGTCYLASEVPTDDTVEGRVFCVKMCQYRTNELLALQLAKKENVAEIIEFYGATIKGKDVRIFTEFMAGGTIADLIQEKKSRSSTDTDVDGMSWPIIWEMDGLSYLEDVLKAVKFLHTKEIVHRDIKGENVLLNENRLHAKLADFGSAENIMDSGPSIDIWKTGYLLLEMLNGERPPPFIDEGTLRRQNSCKPEDYIPKKAIDETKELLRLLFGIDRRYPPTAAEVLKCPHVFPVKELLKRHKEPSKGSEKLG